MCGNERKRPRIINGFFGARCKLVLLYYFINFVPNGENHTYILSIKTILGEKITNFNSTFDLSIF